MLRVPEVAMPWAPQLYAALRHELAHYRQADRQADRQVDRRVDDATSAASIRHATRR